MKTLLLALLFQIAFISIPFNIHAVSPQQQAHSTLIINTPSLANESFLKGIANRIKIDKHSSIIIQGSLDEVLNQAWDMLATSILSLTKLSRIELKVNSELNNEQIVLLYEKFSNSHGLPINISHNNTIQTIYIP